VAFSWIGSKTGMAQNGLYDCFGIVLH